jgi:hypothetical protein
MRYTLKKVVLNGVMIITIVLSISLKGSAQQVNTKSVDPILIAKNFPLLFKIDRSKELVMVLKGNKVFEAIKKGQIERTQKALQQCSNVLCYADALQFTPTEIKLLGDELISLQSRTSIFKSTIAALKKEGSYALYESAADTTFLRSAWNNAAAGINRIADVYIRAKSPRYAKIDSISFSPNDAGFKASLYTAIKQLTNKTDGNLFYTLPLNMAISILKINGRDEAARYEPLNDGLNKLPISMLASTNWAKYKYSVIMVPGQGPEIPGVALDPMGMKRCDDAVLRYHKGLAPFIVVSGGHVHPYKTPYNEAIQMKKYIVEQLHVPAGAVFIEPHARHTTTNLRNTIRMIYRFGLPVSKPVLIVTDKSQSSYIAGQMSKTAMRDLGYLLYKNLTKIGEEETEFYPIWDSLQVDPMDPLDP